MLGWSLHTLYLIITILFIMCTAYMCHKMEPSDTNCFSYKMSYNMKYIHEDVNNELMNVLHSLDNKLNKNTTINALRSASRPLFAAVICSSDGMASRLSN